MLSMLVALLTLCNASCSSDGNEPDDPSSPGSNNSVVINSDGTATGGAVFSRVDANTFFLDYVKYKIVDSHLEIIGCDNSEISDEPKLYAEVTIDGVLYKTRYIELLNGHKIKSVVIPETVTLIKYMAFTYCQSLTTVKFLGKRTVIDDCAFRGCESLTTVELPEELTTIGRYAFSECWSLAELVFKGDVPLLGAGCIQSRPVAYVPMQYVDNYKKYADYFSEIIGY